MKIGCVIQGDIRRGTSQILQELPKNFDFTVLSTWADDECEAPSGDYALVVSDQPSVGGLSNRNYQRLSTARGIQAAKEAGCDYVLKWRTDMLPAKLHVKKLLEWANYNVPAGMKSRLVIPAFRNLSVVPDWFSSIPDLFSFGHIEQMEMLWGDENFNYSLDMNVPDEMREDLGGRFPDLPNLYCAESELYAIFKARLHAKLGVRLSHPKIAADYFRLFDHQRLGIYWFGKTRGFRSIAQAWEHPWWTEENWENGEAEIVPSGYPVIGMGAKVRQRLSPIRSRIDEYRQSMAWGLRR
jgi:hypothetical protein